MTKKLEDLLNIADVDEDEKKPSTEISSNDDTFRDIAELDKINAALPAVKG